MKRKYIILGSLVLLILAAYLYWPVRWKYIVIHHSAGSYGNIQHLQDIHDERQGREPIRAISYHYIIGNGNGMEDGAVASDMRKANNLWGVHVSGRNWDRNFRGLGICIIGNLDEKPMTEKQYQSLLRLVRQLMNDYDIALEDVGFHGKIPGEYTQCPGKHFPYERLLLDLQKGS